MTAPDPRVGEIEARLAEFLRQFRRQTSIDTSVIHTVWSDPEADAAPLLPCDIDALLAELRKAQEAPEKAKAEAWDEGFDRGFYDPLAGSDRDASESLAHNPYRDPS